MMRKSLGSLAEDIINKDFQLLQEDNLVSPDSNVPPQLAESQKDVRNIEVPDSFMKLVLGESSKNVEEKEEELPETTLFGNPAISPQILLDKLTSLVNEARKVVGEMTTVGMLGVNMAGPAKKKGQNNPHAICTSQKKKSGMDHAAWKRCVSHVKGKK